MRMMDERVSFPGSRLSFPFRCRHTLRGYLSDQRLTLLEKFALLAKEPAVDATALLRHYQFNASWFPRHRNGATAARMYQEKGIQVVDDGVVALFIAYAPR